MITWIIENIAREDSYKELAAAVKKAGHPLIEINGDYKTETLYDINVRSYDEIQCVIFNGSIEMTKLIRKDLTSFCRPIAYCHFEKYQCSRYYPYFGANLFNDKYIILPLIEVKRQKFFVFGAFGKEGVVFIRPDSGEKTFQAQLVDILDLDKFVDNNKDVGNDLVIVSTPKNIRWEGRFVVNRDKEVIAHSTYRYQGQKTLIPAVPEAALKKCREILEINYYPDNVFCIDLAGDSDENYWLLELTSFSSAGLYASNKDKIVEKVSAMALLDSKGNEINLGI